MSTYCFPNRTIYKSYTHIRSTMTILVTVKYTKRLAHSTMMQTHPGGPIFLLSTIKVLFLKNYHQTVANHKTKGSDVTSLAKDSKVTWLCDWLLFDPLNELTYLYLGQHRTPVVCTQLWHHCYPNHYDTLFPTLH